MLFLPEGQTGCAPSEIEAHLTENTFTYSLKRLTTARISGQTQLRIFCTKAVHIARSRQGDKQWLQYHLAGGGGCGMQTHDCQYFICDDWIEGVFSLYENRRSGNVALSRFHALLISCELESETCRQGPGPSLAGAEAAEEAR